MIVCGDIITELPRLPPKSARLIVADPPYRGVQTSLAWDNQWVTEDDYIAWTLTWLRLASEQLRDDGLIYVFGQLGKREHVWLHVCSAAARELQFHDMLIWDRVVGYNERRDSFTPQYEMILVLRRPGPVPPFFNKDAVRVPYDAPTRARYLRDRRYRDLEARRAHLERGRYATNLMRVPSLKGSHREKVGHPTQKPEALIEKIVLSSSAPGDLVLDLFAGSGTTSAVCLKHGRHAIAIERDPGHINRIRARLAPLTPTPAQTSSDNGASRAGQA